MPNNTPTNAPNLQDDTPLFPAESAPDRAKQLLSDPHQTLCFCHAVPVEKVVALIEAGDDQTIQQFRQHCAASTGCGSCAPDITALIRLLRDRNSK